MGNLCRHTLCMTDLYQSKSKLVAKRLTNIDPNIHTTYAERYLDIDETGALVPDLSSFDIIIDSTGEDQVLALLSATVEAKNCILLKFCWTWCKTTVY